MRLLSTAAQLLVFVGVLLLLAVGQAQAQGAYTQTAAGMPLPAGITNTGSNWNLYDTACSTTDSCVAIGNYQTASTSLPYVSAITDGRPGPAVSVTPPANADSANHNAGLNAVACQSSNLCTAFGYYNDSSNHEQMMVVQITKGVPAAAVEVQAPADAAANNIEPQAISCPVTGTCVIAGYYESTTTANNEPLVVAVNDGVPAAAVTVAIPSNHAAGAATGELTDVACQSAGSCTAVGDYDNTTSSPVGMVVQITGGVPGAAVETVPADAYSAGPDNHLDYVACPASGACEAAGTYYNQADEENNFVEPISAGIPGTPVAVAAPADHWPSEDYVSLAGISCSSASLCVAAGYYDDSSSDYEPVLIPITSSGASAQESQLPFDANPDTKYRDGAFYDYSPISCVPGGMCVAAGYYGLTRSSYTGMVQEISATGQIGSVEPMPAPADVNNTNNANGPGPYSDLYYGTSCDSSGSCVSTGDYYSTADVTTPFELTLQAPLSVSTSSLAGATESAPYQATLAAGGDWGIYTWSLSSGSLPAGLTLNAQTGVISGTPTGSGTSTFTVEATGTGVVSLATGLGVQTATQSLSLTVAAVAPKLSLLSAGGKVTRNKLAVKLSCTEAPCYGTAKIEITKVVVIKRGKKHVRKHETVVLGDRHYSLAAGASATVAVTLNGAGKRALAKARKHRLAVTVIATVSAGASVSLHETIYTATKKKKKKKR